MDFIAYFRVSTDKQGAKGLGMDAQKSTVNQYITANNGNLIAEFVEVESGKKTNRNELNKALELAKEKNATLIVSKLDRLARNVEFIFTLKNSGVTFVACDLPDFNTLTIGIFATMAQHEREIISKRTIDALTAKAEREMRIAEKMLNNSNTIEYKTITNEIMENYISGLDNEGIDFQEIANELNNNGYRRINKKTKELELFTASKVRKYLQGFENMENGNTTAKGLEVRKHNAATAKENIQALELVEMYRAKGLTLQQIADKLNKSGYKTRRGKTFTTSQIQLLLTRIK